MSALETELDVSTYQDKETFSFEPEVVYPRPRGSTSIGSALKHRVLVNLAQGDSRVEIRNSINQELANPLGSKAITNILRRAHAKLGTLNTEHLILNALGQGEISFPEVLNRYDWQSRERLSAQEARIIDFKVVNPSFTQPKLGESLGFSSRVIERDITSVKNKLRARTPLQAAVISLAAKVAGVDLVRDEPSLGDNDRILNRLHEFEKTREIYDPGDREQRRLTSYQCEILNLLAQGYNSAEVSELLASHPSFRTIKNICTVIIQKLGAKNTRDAIFIALGKGDLSLSNILTQYEWNQRKPLTGKQIQLVDYIVDHPDWLTSKPSSDPEIKPKTFRNHITKILTKLQARDTTHAAIIGLAARKVGIDLSQVIPYDLKLIQRILEGKDKDLKLPDEPKTAYLQPKDQQEILRSLEFMLNKGIGIFLINPSNQVCLLAAAQTEGQLSDVLQTDKGHRFDSLAAQIGDFRFQKPFSWRHSSTQTLTVAVVDSSTLEKQTAALHPPTQHVIETMLHFVQRAEGDQLHLADKLRARLLAN